MQQSICRNVDSKQMTIYERLNNIFLYIAVIFRYPLAIDKVKVHDCVPEKKVSASFVEYNCYPMFFRKKSCEELCWVHIGEHRVFNCQNKT